MLVEVTLKEFQNLAQLPSAKIVERYGDSAPVLILIVMDNGLILDLIRLY